MYQEEMFCLFKQVYNNEYIEHYKIKIQEIDKMDIESHENNDNNNLF